MDNSSSGGGGGIFQSISDFFSRKNTVLIVAGTAVTTLAAYYLYNKFASRTPLEQMDQNYKTKMFIQKELRRLIKAYQDNGELSKSDFFSVIMLIQMKSKAKMRKEVMKNQRERVNLLRIALKNGYYQDYYDKTIEIMQREFDLYEEQFEKILNKIAISREDWDMYKDMYITTEQGNEKSDEEDVNIQSIEKKVYEYLPAVQLPKSLTRQATKQYMLEVNREACDIFNQNLRDFVEEEQCIPLIIETLAFDLAYVQYNYYENVFRYAIHKYQLQNDPEIKEHLDDYLSS